MLKVETNLSATDGSVRIRSKRLGQQVNKRGGGGQRTKPRIRRARSVADVYADIEPVQLYAPGAIEGGV